MLALGWTIGFGLAAARFASRLDRSPVVWFVFGAILGPIALLLLWQSPPAWCRVCLMPARGMLRSCWWCGEPFHGSPAVASGPSSRAGAGVAAAAAVSAAPRTTATAPTNPGVVPPSTSAMAPAPESPVPTPTATALASPPPATAPSRSDDVPVMDAPSRGLGRRRARGAATTPGSDVPAAQVRTAVAEQTDRPAILATAVYFSGTVRLELGSRYGFVVDGGVLRIVGPLSPSVVAYERPLAGVTTSVAHGRVLLTVPDHRGGELLVFTSVVGLSLDGMAEAILQAAHAAEGT